MPQHPYTASLILLLVLGSASTLLRAADHEVYRSTDAEGRVIFSDQASDKAKPVKIPPTNSIPEVSRPKLVAPASAPANTVAPQAAPNGTGVATGYTRFAIVEPANQETVVAVNGLLRLNIAVEPLPQEGHSLRLLLDGTPTGEPIVGEFMVPGVPRGTHTLEVQLVDRDGTVVQSTGTIEVQVLRPGGGAIGGPRPG